jgi:ATP-dependent Clp protease ATP-binding subunit ClpC
MTTPAQPDKFEKFTAAARRALTLSEQEAIRLNQGQISTLHMLLGILRLDESRAMMILRESHINLSALRAEVEASCVPNSHDEPRAMRTITSPARSVIELAVIEARRLGHHYVGTEHLLLGLAQVGGAAASLMRAGLDLEQARCMAASPPPPSAPPQPPTSEPTG